MKWLLSVIIVSVFINNAGAQNIGIGTATPSNNAILDITSNNKGLMLPRVADTSTIANPTAGLFIYNQNTGSPNFHNGIRWNNLSTSSFTAADSVTCSISGGPELGILTYIQQGGRDVDAAGRPSSSPKAGISTFTKRFDVNSPILKSYLFENIHRSIDNVIFKFYKQNSPSPYYTVKYEDVYVINITDLLEASGAFTESITLSARKVTFGAVVHANEWPGF